MLYLVLSTVHNSIPGPSPGRSAPSLPTAVHPPAGQRACIRRGSGRSLFSLVFKTEILERIERAEIVSERTTFDSPSIVTTINAVHVQVEMVGQPIGCIVAEDVQTARRAAKLVRVEYERLPAILTMEVTAINAIPQNGGDSAQLSGRNGRKHASRDL